MKSRTLAIIGGLVAALTLAIPASAHANLVRAEPGVGASVPTAPGTLRLVFSEAPEPRYSTVAVYSAARERPDRADVRVAPDDPNALLVGVRPLTDGVYTVVWTTVSAVDGHSTGGSYAFIVGTGQSAAAPLPQQTVTFAAPTPTETATKWLIYAGASVFFGALLLGLFVWTPAFAARRDGEAAARARAIGGRLVRVARGALAALLVATAVGCVAQVAKATGRPFTGALDPGALADYLFRTRTGSIWCLRLAMSLLAALLIGVRPSRLVRAPGERGTAADDACALGGIALGANVLLTISLIGHGAASAFLTPLTVALDWLHLLATAVWVGGLAGLAATAPLLRFREPGDRALLRAVAGRFSAAALASVGVLSLTGLYSAWLHVGSLGALPATEYGRALLVKLALFAGLLALGAFNLLRVLPRLAAGREVDGSGGYIRFAAVVGAEAVLGVAVLLVVGVMTGFAPAREADPAANRSPLAQEAKAGDLRVTLTPSTLAPGSITYDVLVEKDGPLRDADRVTVRFASRALGIEETEAVAAPQGDGHYLVAGPYTALPGDWQTRVIVRRAGKDDADAAFTLAIGAVPPAPAGAATTPAVTPATLLYGLLAVLLVVATLAGAATLARRATQRQAAEDTLTPGPFPTREGVSLR